MAGPWEKFQKPGPWSKFQKQGPGAIDYASQALSGINEGIANALGAPVDLLTAGLNLATTGINKVAGTDIPQIHDPAGGSGTFKTLLAPTIREESADPALQMTRRVGQEVGAFAVPGAATVSKSARPAATLAKELTAAVGSGTGAAIAQQVAPDNPLVEFAGQLAGAMTPAGVSRTLGKGGKRVSVDDLRTSKNAAYQAVDNAGVRFAPDDYDNMLVGLVNDVQGKHISPTRHQAAYSFINDMIQRRGKPFTLTELDQLRQEVRRDLVVPSYGSPDKAADAFFGDMIVDAIDDLIASNASGSQAMKAARLAHSRLRKTEMIEDAIVRAERRAASTGSGGNLNNAIRQNLRAILDSKRKSKGFTKEELAELEKVVRQGGLENILRLVGKLSPSGNGLSAWFGIGAASQGYGALPIAGLIAKALADSGTVRKANQLQQRVAGRQPRTLPPPSAAVTYAQGANQAPQDGPVEITVRGGAR